MNKKDLARFHKLLIEERDRVANDLGVIEAGAKEATRAASGQSYSNHMADVGSDVMEQETAFIQASRGADYLRTLVDALKRVDDGTYGTCEDCGNKIPQKRLEAYLAARLCIECKSRLEKQRG